MKKEALLLSAVTLPMLINRMKGGKNTNHIELPFFSEKVHDQFMDANGISLEDVLHQIIGNTNVFFYHMEPWEYEFIIDELAATEDGAIEVPTAPIEFVDLDGRNRSIQIRVGMHSPTGVSNQYKLKNKDFSKPQYFRYPAQGLVATEDGILISIPRPEEIDISYQEWIEKAITENEDFFYQRTEQFLRHEFIHLLSKACAHSVTCDVKDQVGAQTGCAYTDHPSERLSKLTDALHYPLIDIWNNGTFEAEKKKFIKNKRKWVDQYILMGVALPVGEWPKSLSRRMSYAPRLYQGAIAVASDFFNKKINPKFLVEES